MKQCSAHAQYNVRHEICLLSYLVKILFCAPSPHVASLQYSVLHGQCSYGAKDLSCIGMFETNMTH